MPYDELLLNNKDNIVYFNEKIIALTVLNIFRSVPNGIVITNRVGTTHSHRV